MGDDSDPNPEKHEKNETARRMLQIYHERSNQLANMLIALNGFMLAFIGGLLAFVGSSAFSNSECKNVSFDTLISSGCLNPWPLYIAINIAIITLFFWRKYSHFVDDDIKETYCKILACEKDLQIDFNATLLKSLVQENLKSNLTREDIQQLYDHIFEKFEKGEVPERGHKNLDCCASIFIIIFTIMEVCIAYSMPKNSTDIFFGLVLPILIIGGWGVGLETFLMTNRIKPLKKCKQFRLFESKKNEKI